MYSSPTPRPDTSSMEACPASFDHEVDIVAMARETRRSAEAFAQCVADYGDRMPAALDRFHATMTRFRETARDLRRGLGRETA